MNRQRGRASTWWLAVASLLGLVGVLAVWLSQGWVAVEQMPVRYLRLEKPVLRVNRENLRAALTPWAGSNFFSVDLDRVKETVEALPWVARVQVRKAWPDTLWLDIEEHVPVARWAEDKLVDQHGELFDVPPGYVPRDLPRLQAGVDHRAEVVEMFAWLRQQLHPHGLRLSHLERNGLGSWRLQLGNGTQVMLGRKDVRRRLHTFLRVWEKQGPKWQRELVRADMRYTNGMAVHMAGPAVVARKEDEHGQG